MPTFPSAGPQCFWSATLEDMASTPTLPRLSSFYVVPIRCPRILWDSHPVRFRVGLRADCTKSTGSSGGDSPQRARFQASRNMADCFKSLELPRDQQGSVHTPRQTRRCCHIPQFWEVCTEAVQVLCISGISRHRPLELSQPSGDVRHKCFVII